MILPFGVDDDGRTPADVDPVALAKAGARVDEEMLGAMARKYRKSRGRGVPERARANDLGYAGWGVIFAPGLDRKVHQALERLLKHRKAEIEQAKGDVETKYRVFDGDYNEGESAQRWLSRHAVRWATVEPTRMPYYLLIVASPRDIPYSFQTELDLYFAVGRIWFEKRDSSGNCVPDVKAFKKYADDTVEYDEKSVAANRHMVFFATRNEGDRATPLLIEQLVKPLLGCGGHERVGLAEPFTITDFLEEKAKKETLRNVFNGEIPHGPPSLLFTGTHGRKPGSRNARFKEILGAPICQEWKHGVKAKEDDYFAASDLKDSAQVRGVIHFMFACYGLGSPKLDSYAQPGEDAREVARSATVSQLPQRLLSHPNGAALAVLGHIDAAYASTWQTYGGAGQETDFRAIINNLMGGFRIGEATDQLNLTWAGQHFAWQQLMDDEDCTEAELRDAWINAQDAKHFAIFGDPAVRLRV